MTIANLLLVIPAREKNFAASSDASISYCADFKYHVLLLLSSLLESVSLHWDAQILLEVAVSAKTLSGNIKVSADDSKQW